MTRNGKIALLPKVVLEQLNRRLDDHEPGQRLVVWLNSLPEVNAVLMAEFGGRPIREQNLSEWRKGGYRDWQRRQERYDLLRQMRAETGELGAVMDGDAFSKQLSFVLMADLALVMRDVMEQIKDPKERAHCLAQLAGKIAQLRREESHSIQAGVVRQRWERELAQAEDYKQSGVPFMPGRALIMQRMYLDMLGQSGGDLALEMAGLTTGGGGVKTKDPTGFVAAHPAQSDLLRPAPSAANPGRLGPTAN